MNEFDKIFQLNPYLNTLRLELSQLPQSHQVAFAATICERVFPFYFSLAQFLQLLNGDKPRKILDQVWEHVLKGNLSENEITNFISFINDLDLGEEDCCEKWELGVIAIDSIGAALKSCLDDSGTMPALIADIPMNEAHQIVFFELTEDNPDLSPSECAEVLNQIESYEIMIQEKKWQKNLLCYLKEHKQLSNVEIDYLKELAENTPIPGT